MKQSSDFKVSSLKFEVSGLKFGVASRPLLNACHSLRLLIFFFALFASPVLAQSDYVHLTKIGLEGNKKTKEVTILRELNLHLGDSILVSDIGARLEENQKRLMSTGLFLKVELNIKLEYHCTHHRI